MQASVTSPQFSSTPCTAIAIMAFLAVVSSAADAPPPATESTTAARRLEQMRERARRATVRIVSESSQTKTTAESPEVQLEQQPILRYSDPPRDFRDGTLWIWTSNGRPVAVGKVEDLRKSATGGATWITCFASLYPGLIEANWQAGPSWTSQKPGLQFQSIHDFEKPETSEVGRLRQFKKLSERFTISLERDYFPQPDSQQLRRLPRHLHRYRVPEQNITDAVLFGWTTNGTNPDALIAIELRSVGDKHEWHYAMSQVTSDNLILNLNGKKVQEAVRNISGTGPALRYFFEPNATPIE